MLGSNKYPRKTLSLCFNETLLIPAGIFSTNPGSSEVRVSERTAPSFPLQLTWIQSIPACRTLVNVDDMGFTWPCLSLQPLLESSSISWNYIPNNRQKQHPTGSLLIRMSNVFLLSTHVKCRILVGIFCTIEIKLHNVVSAYKSLKMITFEWSFLRRSLLWIYLTLQRGLLGQAECLTWPDSAVKAGKGPPTLCFDGCGHTNFA